MYTYITTLYLWTSVCYEAFSMCVHRVSQTSDFKVSKMEVAAKTLQIMDVIM